MITVSKGLSPPVLAQGWMNDLGARPDMSIKVGFLSHDMRIAGSEQIFSGERLVSHQNKLG